MKVALAAIGSLGDVRPVVEVACQVRQRGHDVRLVVLNDYADVVRRAGLRAHSVDADSVAAMWPDSPWRRRAALAQPGIMYALMRSRFTRASGPIADAIFAAGADADLLVAGTATHGAVHALAESTGARVATLLLAPLLPSSELAAGVLVPRLGGGRIRTVTSGGLWAMTRSLGAGPKRAMRTRVGPPPTGQRGQPHGLELLVNATSPHISPPSWRIPAGAHAVQTGWITSTTFPGEEPDPSGSTQPGDVRAALQFLTEHHDAVLMTFGSCPSADPHRDVELFVEVARLLGRPLLLQTAAVPPGPVSSQVWNAPGVDHHLLVPHVSAVVHHGGAGTTMAVLACGTPAVVVPHLGDQHYYARRVTELGVGASAGPRWRVTPRSIARQLRHCEHSAIRRRAQSLGALLAAENGAQDAAGVLEAWAQGSVLSDVRGSA